LSPRHHLLKLGMKIYSYNDHVRLLSPGPVGQHNQLYSSGGADIVLESTALKTPARAVFLPQADLHPSGGMPYFQCLRHGRPPPMGKNRIKPNYRRRALRLPDLDHCKATVLNSLGSPASRRVYDHSTFFRPSPPGSAFPFSLRDAFPNRENWPFISDSVRL